MSGKNTKWRRGFTVAKKRTPDFKGSWQKKLISCQHTCHNRPRNMIKIDPEKRAKSVVLNPHLWSLKRTSSAAAANGLASRPRGRPRKNPLPNKVAPSSLGEPKRFSLEAYFCKCACLLRNWEKNVRPIPIFHRSYVGLAKLCFFFT